MIRDDQFIGQLEDYLDAFDGATPLPDRVRGAVHAALPSLRQVRPLPGPLRRFHDSRDRSLAAGWGMIAAALVISIGVGTLFLSSGRNHDSAATPSPTGAPSPSPSYASGPVVEPGTLLNNGQYRSCDRGGPPTTCLTSGTYTLGNGLLRTNATFDLPTGWFEWNPGTGSQGVLVERSDIPGGGSGWGVLFSAVGAVWRDPCDSSKGTFPAASTNSVDGLLIAMASWPNFDVSAPRSIALGRATGKEVAVSSRMTTTDCPNGVIWHTPQETAIDAYPMVAERASAYTAQFLVLDVGGEVLAIRTTDFPQTSPFEVSQGIAPDPGRHRAEQATLHAILDSIRFGGGS